MDQVKHSRWSLKSIIFTTLVSVFCGVIYWGIGFLYTSLTIVFTPMGLAPLANDISMGLWCMAGPMVGMITKRVGGAFLGEFLSSGVEAFIGGQWGAAAFISGLVQGLGSEIGFTLTGYKNFDRLGVDLSVVTVTIVSFIWDWFKNGYNQYSIGLLAVFFVVRLISTYIFGSVLTRVINKQLEKSHLSFSD